MATEPSTLELHDIQNGAMHPRPSPYFGVYILLRIDEAEAGRELLRRLLPHLSSATHPTDGDKQAWVSVALTFQGLKALGVPPASLDSFPQAFAQGMAARAELLGDVGKDAPENWEAPLGSPDVHVDRRFGGGEDGQEPPEQLAPRLCFVDPQEDVDAEVRRRPRVHRTVLDVVELE